MTNAYTRRDFLRLAGMGAAAIALPTSGLFAAETRKPNVIVILADDQGFADVGVHGCKDSPTPYIDSIAKNGVRFTDGYTSCPVCSPMRAGLLTGRHQQRFGFYHNPPKDLDRTNWGLPLDQKTFAQYMKELGYATGIVGKWHQGDNEPFHPNKRGFDEFFGFIGGAHNYMTPESGSFNMVQRNGKPVEERDYLTYAFGREAVSFIEQHKDEPFFLYLAFNAPHSPLQAAIRDRKAFPEIEDNRRRTFAQMQLAMDKCIGDVLAKVRLSGLEEDTLIIYMSDNGGPTPGNTSRNDPFKGFKTQVHEGGIHVPFMMQWKGRISAGKTYSKPIISLDLLPTAVAAAGGKVAANVDGVDLMPYITGKKSGAPHESLCWQFDKQSAIRKGDWKLSKHEDKGVRLYNLANDPTEKNDLAAEDRDKVSELLADWDKWNAGNIKPLWPSKSDAAWTNETW